jgi:hypothetical protein
MSTVTLGKNESIVIGNDIIVTILAVRGDEVEIEIRRSTGDPVECGEPCCAVSQSVNRSESWT